MELRDESREETLVETSPDTDTPPRVIRLRDLPDSLRRFVSLRELEARQEVLAELLEKLAERARDLSRGAADLCQELDEVTAQIEERTRAPAPEPAEPASRPTAPRRRRRAWQRG